MFQEGLRIPKERVAVLIGKRGNVKNLIEKKLKVKLELNEEEDVILTGEDNLKIYTASIIVKAIGRGFSPEIALKLLNENYFLEVIELNEFCNKSRNKQLRVKSRLIGTRGKARRYIENLTDTNICIYGKTVSIIGEENDVMLARQALERLIQGSKHETVYYFIKKCKETKI